MKDIDSSLYPKSHLWGVDSLCDKNDNLINKISCPDFVNQFLRRFLFSRFSPGLTYEIPCIFYSYRTKFMYSVCGPLSLARFYGQSKLFSWVFSVPPPNIINPLNPYHPKNLKSNAGFLCLTPAAEKHFSQFAPSKFIPWCVDQKLFNGEPPLINPNKPFFLASGKTGRDYDTLVKAANYTNAEIRIIGPRVQKPRDLPSNVNWIDTSSNPPDQAIDYPTLKEWYAQCTAVCIPLSGDANDTCGYTNVLEAMAMRKPVLMTRSGCLHINPQSDGFGIQIKPRDVRGWTQAMNRLHKDHEKALYMGNRGRKIVERDFTIERFNKDVLDFIETILNKS